MQQLLENRKIRLLIYGALLMAVLTIWPNVTAAGIGVFFFVTAVIVEPPDVYEVPVNTDRDLKKAERNAYRKGVSDAATAAIELGQHGLILALREHRRKLELGVSLPYFMALYRVSTLSLKPHEDYDERIHGLIQLTSDRPAQNGTSDEAVTVKTQRLTILNGTTPAGYWHPTPVLPVPDGVLKPGQ